MKFLLTSLLLASVCFSASAKQISIMAYNVENFFDTQHDSNTEDWTWLPQETKKTIQGFAKKCEGFSTQFYVRECMNLDWTTSKMTNKINNIAKVLKASDKSGMGPDIVAFEEIENINAVNFLVNNSLKGMGYKSVVLIEGDDSRGIDVALISKYPVTRSTRHAIFVQGRKLNTRGILEVEVDVNGKKVVVFVNHWPSQANPAEERLASAEVLKTRSESVKADLVVALGDFNTLDTDVPRPFEPLNNFFDAETEARRLNVTLNPGTHYFRGEWTSLDHLFVHKALKGVQPLWKSYKIVAEDFMMTSAQDHKGKVGTERIPNRFNASQGTGFSDHLPIMMAFEI